MPVLTTLDATWVNPGAVTYDAGELRRADAALFASEGISTGLTVTVNASDEVTVSPGSGVISGESAVAGTGVYRGGISAAATGPLDPRNATNPRIDLVVLRQYDPDVIGTHSEYKAKVEVITGTPGASPSAPALPSLAIELGRLTVPATGGGAVSVDSSKRKYATAVHRPLFDHAVAEGSAGSPPPSTSWATVSGGITRSFTAPASGRVKVTIGAYLYQSKAGERQLYGYKLSGGTVRDPLDSETVQVYGTSAISGSRVFVLSGLTPGTTYTLTEAYRTVNTTAGNAYMASRSLIIEGA